jgi:hypothetical protein
VRAKTVH